MSVGYEAECVIVVIVVVVAKSCLACPLLLLEMACAVNKMWNNNTKHGFLCLSLHVFLFHFGHVFQALSDSRSSMLVHGHCRYGAWVFRKRIFSTPCLMNIINRNLPVQHMRKFLLLRNFQGFLSY